MAKIIAIHGGGDWNDASADYLVLPDGMNVWAEKAAWREWYENKYIPALHAGKRPQYVMFEEWLKSKGARDPNGDELEIFYND